MNALQELNWGLIAPILLLQFILMIVALFDCLKNENLNGPKWLWILVILFINTLGPIVYFIFGRGNR
ncbi:transcriptional regulator [Salipaludibacillus neizhouensis]|uniref:Transcriptional regulator n=1 Tax=Salipaludibacillus neizhouensis TaxID=885475 RepID=A0A3A9K172_9BACI|nr:transcriptional regulator [Salipaludibacillus neizhouensis]